MTILLQLAIDVDSFSAHLYILKIFLKQMKNSHTFLIPTAVLIFALYLSMQYTARVQTSVQTANANKTGLVSTLQQPASSLQQEEPDKNHSPEIQIKTMDGIKESEYAISYHKEVQALQSPNRANNMRFTYHADGFEVKSRVKDAESWQIKMNLKGLYRDKIPVLVPISNPVITLNGNQLVYHHNTFDVEYINNMHGMRQNFIVHQKPNGSSPLKVMLQVKADNLMMKCNGNVLSATWNNKIKYNYSNLKVWDADKIDVPAHMELENNLLAIVVNDHDARYPLTIDPLCTSPDATVESNQHDAEMGWSVASAGDVNGDGYSDVIVGASFYDHGETNEGRAYLFKGSANGISITPSAILEINNAHAQFGSSVASAGDVNGDGYSDVIVGAPEHDNISSEGAAFIYHGSVVGLNTTPATSLICTFTYAKMGCSVASAGDVNSDGYSDVIVGAYEFLWDDGASFVYYGSVNGIGYDPDTIKSEDDFSWMGKSVASAGDVNGDGYSDVIVGAPRWAEFEWSGFEVGAAFVYHGSATGIITTPAVTLSGSYQNSLTGNSVASAGDINGDSYSDVIVGAYTYEPVSVYFGSATGIDDIAEAVIDGLAPVASAGDVNSDGFDDVIFREAGFNLSIYHGSAAGLNIIPAVTLSEGLSVASAGDVNGDGYSDVIVGDPGYSNGQTDEGAAFIYYGATDKIFYGDYDGDGFGNGALSTIACSQPLGYVSDNTDCNDSEITAYPGAPELCDHLDNNCNGQIDEGFVHPPATVTPSGNVSVCTGANLVLTANTGAGFTYKWFKDGIHISGATTSSYSVTVAGTYTVEVTTSSGCSTTSTATTVAIFASPTATISPNTSVTICSGQKTTLTANSGSGLTYQWLNDGSNISGATSKTYKASVQGNYKVKVTNSSGCSTTSSATTVNVNALPAATITPSATVSICTGATILLTANTGAGLTYKWFKDNVAISGANLSTYAASVGAKYTVQVTNSSGCSLVSLGTTVKIITYPSATITPSGSVSICSGITTTLTANSGSTAINYQWFKDGALISGAISKTYKTTEAGQFQVKITNSTGCSTASLATTVSVNPLPSASISPSGTVSICMGATITLTANSGSGLTYKWEKDGNPIAGASNNTYTTNTSEDGKYTVVVTNASGCSLESAATTVKRLADPNAEITILNGGNLDLCNGEVKLKGPGTTGTSWQWYKGINPLAGATSQNYIAITAGTFKVEVTNSSGCIKKSDNGVQVIKTCKESSHTETEQQINVSIYPNPSSGTFGIIISNINEQNISVKVVDLLGQIIYARQYSADEFGKVQTISLGDVASGNYIVQILNGGNLVVKQLVVQR